ncbi:MAG TPA: amino acid adenylation domain-containing protein, partial [Ktedonobacteraceae bacterium]|nr:amino acid adenylation domain-containing protein [Ktedonobacteraceae bacterium]
SDDPSVRELLLRVREVALGAYAHQDIPFERLVEELQPERNVGHNPLFQVMLALQNAPAKPLALPGLELQLAFSQSETSKFDLSLELWESSEGLSGMMEYSTDLFNAGTIRRMLNHYQQLLTAMVEQPGQRLSALSLLTEDEREQLRAWNATKAVYPQDFCLHILFEQQVAQSPDRIALIFEDRQCTYSDLNARANQLAHLLKSRGIGPDTPVGICLDRSCELVIGVLGILKAGGAYVPLNPDYPKERLAFILQDTHTPLLLTQRRLIERLPEARPSLLVLDSEWAAIEAHQNDNPHISLYAHNLAYIIYTSGSTGTPKGIAMPHAPLVNLFSWHYRTAPLPPGARTLQFASLSFDVSAQEIFCTLCFGQTLILLLEEQRLDPVKLLALLRREAIERLFIPVVMLQQLAQIATIADCSHLALREIITAGEQLQITPQVVQFFEQLHHCRLYNHYGPSETHAASTYLLAEDPQDWPALPAIGKPVANVELYVLDRHLQMVPVGIAGELYIGGLGLARGYISRPDLTAERFVPHFVGTLLADQLSEASYGSGVVDRNCQQRFIADPSSERLYKTGDLVCYLPDGNLQFLGRADQQVKIRGFRIEPGEIEVILNRHPAVQDALIQVREDTPGEKRLVAYVVTERSSPPPAITQLRQYLQKQLPDYMVPTHFVLRDAFPLNSSGKVNRHALPAPLEGDIAREDSQRAPRTPLEEQIAEIWREVLHLEQVGIHDNFFSLGGHSLLATQVVSRIREIFAVEVPLKMLFEAPFIAELAEYVEQVKPHQQEHDQFSGRDTSGPYGNEPLRIPVLERGSGDIEQLLEILEQLSSEEAQALLALDATTIERETAE